MSNSTDFNALLAQVRDRRPGLRADSRQVEPGDVFVAAPGVSADGAKFIPDALRAGAAYVVCRRRDFDSLGDTAQWNGAAVFHDNPRQALADLAGARYGHLTDALEIFAITGTNGKTTCAYLLEHFFTAMGRKCGVIGTVNYRWPGHLEDAPLTTPDLLRNYEMLAAMREAGADTAIMEVSSHALDQGRVAGINFAGAAFTNLTQDHLDYHADMEEYFLAKSRLFLDSALKSWSGRKMAINTDDAWGRRLYSACPHALGFGLDDSGRGLKGRLLSMSPAGIELEASLDGGPAWIIKSPLVGAYNASNLLAVQAVALNCGYAPADLGRLESFYGVPGRLERIENGRGLNIFVDYAHTPDALVNAQKALRGAGFSRLITVFGCGGNRDRKKRPLMGEAVAAYADVAVLTSDNPRHEEPMAIIEDVLPGLGKAARLLVEPDRKKATALAIEMLGPQDALLVAGKGHESHQQIGAVKYPYSDQQTIKEITCVSA